MADEVINFAFQFTGQDQFTSAMNQMAASAEQMVSKVNAAFSGIKQPGSAGGAAADPLASLKQHAEETKGKLAEMAETAGVMAAQLGARFGESGKLLGEFGEKSLAAIAGIGTAFGGIKAHAAEAAKETGKISEAAEGAAAGGGLSRMSAIFAAIPPQIKAIAAVVAGGLGLEAFGAEAAEKIEKMSFAAHATVEEFRQMQAVGEAAALGPEQMASAMQTVNTGVREAALNLQQMAEQFSVMGERLQYFRDRIAQMQTMRGEAAHQAEDESKQSARSIEQAERHLKELQDTQAEQDRAKRGVSGPEDARRAAAKEDEKRAQSLKDAEDAVTDARHKQDDEGRRQSERRQQEHIAEERALTMQRRMEVQQQMERRRAEEAGPPIQRAFVQYAEQVKGIKDFSEALLEAQKMAEGLRDKTSGEKFTGMLEVFQQLREHGVDTARTLQEAFGDSASRISKHLDDLVERGRKSPEALSAVADELGKPTAKTIESLGNVQESIDKTMQKFHDMAVNAGQDFAGIIALLKGLSSLLEGIANIPDRIRAGAKGETLEQFKKEQAEAAKKDREEVEAKEVPGKEVEPVKLGDVDWRGLFGYLGGRLMGQSEEEAMRGVGRGPKGEEAPKADEAAASTAKLGSSSEQASGNVEDLGSKSGDAGSKVNALGASADSASHPIGAFGEAVQSAISALKGLVGGAGGGGGGGGEGQQHGGLISGPGTGTSDSIPIRASAGEYVVRASAVSHLGKSFMDRVNAAGYHSGGIVMPGFSLGGVVNAFNLEMPRFQAGGHIVGPAPSAPLHPVTLNLPGGQSISGFHATPDAVAELNKHAVLAQASSTGRKPSWVR